MVGSLALAIWGSFALSQWSFYLLPFRAWEFGFGALVALAAGPLSGRWAWLGLALIAGAVGLGHPDQALATAAAAVCGTALILSAAQPGAALTRLLSLAPAVWIGGISYSFYLWHQPIFAFGRWISPAPLGPWPMGGLTLLVLVLAWATTVWIERPIYKGPLPAWLRPRPVAGGLSLLTAAALIAVALQGHLSGGRNANGWMIADDPPLRYGPCWIQDLPTVAAQDACTADLGDRPVVVLVGDSHTWGVSTALHQHLTAQGKALVTVVQRGCPPIPGMKHSDPTIKYCAAFGDEIWQAITSFDPVEVILVARWTMYVEGTWYTNSWGVRELPSGSIQFARTTDGADDPAALTAHLDAQLTQLAQEFPLTVIAPIPEAAWSPPRLAAAGHLDLLTYDRADYDARHHRVLPVFERLAATGVPVIFPADTLCADGLCRQVEGGEVLYLDDDHLNLAGAKRVFEPRFSLP